MLKVLILVGLLSLAVVSPAVVRSREEIEAYRSFLERTRTDDGSLLVHPKFSQMVKPQELSGKFEGDIVLDDWMVDTMVQQYAQGRNALILPNRTWPNNTVVWEYGDNEFDERDKQVIDNAIADIESNSCVKFRKRNPGEVPFVQVTSRPDGCYAHVGFRINREIATYNLGRPGCVHNTVIIHEWFHILGFYHMQSTHDRDDYVKILVENIIPGYEHAFDKYGPGTVDNLGLEYEYDSCMHYSARAFSANGEPTIVALKEHEGTMGQQRYITDLDWLRLKRHYNCPGAWD